MKAGETISHYRVLEKVGEGGMGTVWKAEDVHRQRVVVLEFLSMDDDGTDEAGRWCEPRC